MSRHNSQDLTKGLMTDEAPSDAAQQQEEVAAQAVLTQKAFWRADSGQRAMGWSAHGANALLFLGAATMLAMGIYELVRRGKPVPELDKVLSKDAAIGFTVAGAVLLLGVLTIATLLHRCAQLRLWDLKKQADMVTVNPVGRNGRADRVRSMAASGGQQDVVASDAEEDANQPGLPSRPPSPGSTKQ